MKKKIVFVVPPKNIEKHESAETKIKEGCSCTKSQCLKLYCQCFGVKKLCESFCKCLNCKNNNEESNDRIKAISKQIQKKYLKDEMNDKKGCQCKKSKCQQNYCVCFINGKGCTDICNCKKCKNKKQQQNDQVDKNIFQNIKEDIFQNNLASVSNDHKIFQF